VTCKQFPLITVKRYKVKTLFQYRCTCNNANAAVPISYANGLRYLPSYSMTAKAAHATGTKGWT
jgi:hypothetical protein